MQGNVEMYKVLRKGADHQNRWGIDSLKLLLTSSWMDNYKGILICDVDGCIRDGSHRLNLLPSQNEIEAVGDTPNIAFRRFNEECHLDTPILPVISLVDILSKSGYYIVILTSCTHSGHTFPVLIDQLDEWEVPTDVVVMRGRDNHLHPIEFKKQFIYDSGIDTLTSNKYALDDCNGNCNMFRENGFTALQTEEYTRFSKGDTK